MGANVSDQGAENKYHRNPSPYAGQLIRVRGGVICPEVEWGEVIYEWVERDPISPELEARLTAQAAEAATHAAGLSRPEVA